MLSFVYATYLSFIFTVIHLQFEQPTYTFSEDTQTSDAIIKIVISNYDELVIEHDVSVTIVGFPNASNATHDGMNNDTVVSMETCINTHAGYLCRQQMHVLIIRPVFK